MVGYIIITIVAAAIMVVVGFLLGSKNKGNHIENLELTDSLRSQITQLNEKIKTQEDMLMRQYEQITKLTSERDVQKANADNYRSLIDELKASHNRQLEQTKEGADKQIEALRLMNKEQIDSQMKLIREQMQTTSEEVLKRRQEELGERNREQVSKIIDPLQQSLKDMQEALDKSKQQQNEAITRLDETIKINMQKSAELGETADRLTRALTGEVKVQGNFGELKLKQLLEDLELKEGCLLYTSPSPRD